MFPKFRKQYIVYYEGLQEKKYFKHIACIINDKYSNIQVTFKEVKNLKSLAESSSAMKKLAFYDYDMNEKEFREKANYSKKVDIYYSNVSFDLWLILHKTFYNKTVNLPHAYLKEVRKAYHLESTDNIKEERVIDKILAQITLEDLKCAMKNAKTVIDSKLDRDKRKVGQSFAYYDNPATNVYAFFEELFEEIQKETKIVI